MYVFFQSTVCITKMIQCRYITTMCFLLQWRNCNWQQQQQKTDSKSERYALCFTNTFTVL